MRQVPYPHPGEILLEEFLRPMGITQYRLAKEIGVPQRRIGQIVAGTRGVTANTGLRLSRFFAMSDGFWIGLQSDYDSAIAKEELSKTLQAIKPWRVDSSVAARRESTSVATAKTKLRRRGRPVKRGGFVKPDSVLNKLGNLKRRRAAGRL